MRRRRNARSKRKSESISAASVVLLLVVAAAFIYVFQTLDIFGILFGPKDAVSPSPSASYFASISPSPDLSASPQPTSTVSTSANGRITEEIKMNGITLYGVQLGVFSKEENAQTVAAKYKPDGAAGYILREEALYRVVDSVYYNQDDAKAVRDAYEKGTASLLRVEVSGINWNVTATREQIQAIRGSISVMQSQIVVLIDTQKKLQKKQGTVEEHLSIIKTSGKKFDDASTAMMTALGPTSSPIIKKLNDSLLESADSLNTLAETNATDTVALMSGLKYNIIDILLKLEQKLITQ